MDFFSLDPRELPTTTLWRVQYPDSQTAFDSSASLTARDTKTIYTDFDDIFVDFGGAVEDHLWWPERRPSIFISLFANRWHAENWALRWSDDHGGRECTVYAISACALEGSYVYQAEELRRAMCLQVPAEAEASILNEYLVAHRIPAEAILGCRTTEDIRRGECYLLSPRCILGARNRIFDRSAERRS